MTVSGAASSSSASSSSSSSSGSSSSSNSITSSGNNLTSTIDWDQLIEAAYEAKLAPATNVSDTIQANQAKISAYTKLQGDLSKLTTDLAALSSSDVNSVTSNVFAARTAILSATGSVSAQSLVSLESVAKGTATGNHTLQVTHLAAAQKVASASQSSQTTALGLSGTFSIGLAGGDSASIPVSSGMDLQDIAAAINAQSSTSHVEAQIVPVSSNSFVLTLTGDEDAANINYSSTSGDDILNNLGVTDSSGAFSNPLQAAQSAEFTVDGIALTRNTNDISDVLSGVSFSLLQPTQTGSTVNIDIVPDTDTITAAIQTFVTDYNAFRDDVIAQQATNSDGTAASSAVLFGDGTMRDIMTNIEQVLSSSVAGLSMGNIGLSFNENNELQVDDASQLSTALTTNLDGVIAMLSAHATTSSNQLAVLSAGDSPESFTLDIQVDSSGNLTASVNGDSSLFNVQGNTIVGASGTIYAGMAFNYTGSTSQSITVTATLGMAAQLRQIANDASAVSVDSQGTPGSLQNMISSLTSQDATLQQKVTDIQSAANTFKAQLQARYSEYQAAIQSANNTLNYLSALLNAKSNN
jgi:flagellar hook-associated protein 2